VLQRKISIGTDILARRLQERGKAVFSGAMSRKAYALHCAVRVSIFVAVTIAFPFVLRLIVKNSGCKIDTCGALSLFVSFFAKPSIYVLFVLSLVGVTVRRLRDAGIPVGLAAVVPVLLLADLGFAMAFGAPWSVGFVVGILGPILPKFMLTAFACLIFLCLIPGIDEGDEHRRWGPAGLAALCLLLVMTAYAILALLPAFAPFAGGWKVLQLYIAMGPVLYPLARFFPYAAVGLVVLLAAVAWQQRAGAGLQSV
jgi:uncharacterized membrane protein YhaH (DUF805 family)